MCGQFVNFDTITKKKNTLNKSRKQLRCIKLILSGKTEIIKPTETIRNITCDK